VPCGNRKKKTKVNLSKNSGKGVLGSDERSLVTICGPLASPLTCDCVEANVGCDLGHLQELHFVSRAQHCDAPIPTASGVLAHLHITRTNTQVSSNVFIILCDESCLVILNKIRSATCMEIPATKALLMHNPVDGNPPGLCINREEQGQEIPQTRARLRHRRLLQAPTQEGWLKRRPRTEHIKNYMRH